MALGAVDEDGDSQEVVADRQLPAGKNGPARDRVVPNPRKLMPNRRLTPPKIALA